ncbi:DUF4163 domain-containing protein [Paenibacillus sp. sptzw28]|uniref:stalk domain-containing protein n=1 Tax=Paenibacillus sp. sptzw28 TaxID=715179 RepID=UPI001C6EED00|nr:stalk domain-containing protein [Paenibacillus sp. sptzw28]QYR21050.1 DUF4163 domain-containing protein [Paenibacillus sp. sptzw28]
MKNKAAEMNGKRSKLLGLVLPVAASLLLGSGAASLAVPVNKAEAAPAVHPVQKNMQMQINGASRSVPVVSANGQTFVGLGTIGKDLGLAAAWNGKTRTVSIYGKNKTMEIKAGAGQFTLNGHRISATPAIMKDGRIYLPLRYLEQLGLRIGYITKTKQITITAAAENNVKLINKTKSYKMNDIDSKTTITVQYPQLEGLVNKDVEKKINIALEETAQVYITNGAKILNMNQNSVDHDPTEKAKAEAKRFSYNVDYTFTYNKNNKLSLHFDIYSYTGVTEQQANPDNLYTYDHDPYTFDLGTGNVLTLKQTADDNPDYLKIIASEIKKQVEEKGIKLTKPLEAIDPAQDFDLYGDNIEQNFFLRGDSIIVHYSLDQYTSHTQGEKEFAIPLSLFAKK